MTTTTMCELHPERDDGRVVSYGCRCSDDPLFESPLPVVLPFRYEFTVVNPSPQHIQLLRIELKRENMPEFEEFILYNVMQSVLQPDCAIDEQDIAAYGPISSAAEPPRVVFLTSFAMDRFLVDTPCSQLPRKGSVSLSNDSEPAPVCFLVQGEMNAKYIGEVADEPTVKAFLQDHIKEALKSYKNAGMDDVQMIEEIVQPRGRDQAQQSAGGNSSSGVIGGTVSAAILLLALAGFAFHRRRVRRARADANAKHEIIMDIEPTGAPETTESDHYDPKKTAVPGDEENQNPSSDDDDQELPSSDQLKIPVTLTTLRTASTTTATDDSELPETVSKDSPEDEIKTLTAPSSEEVKMCADPPPTREITSSPIPEKSAIPLVDVLPPKPPTDPHSKAHLIAAMSKPLKVRRKKKKRKKKTKMTRVNSRENITEMETITEGQESDNDSEYSWCSTSDSNASSRQSSPSRSRGGSRDPSPARMAGQSSPIPSLTGSWDNGSGNDTGSGNDSGESSDRKMAEQLPPYLV